MNKKVIFLDCDGTLFDVPRGMPQASEKTKYAIRELIKNGHYVFIATGRCKVLIPDFIVGLNPTGFITSNGACGENTNGIIFKEDVSKESIKAVEDFCEEHDGVAIYETQEHLYVKDLKNKLLNEFIACWDIQRDLFTDDPKYKNDSFQLIMTIFHNEEDCDLFEKELDTKVDYRRQYGFTSFDVAENGLDKGYGVKKILEYYNINREDAYAFGDGLNDFEMIDAVGESYCMENGNPKLKERAKHIAPDCLNDGFYKTMVKDGLIKPMD